MRNKVTSSRGSLSIESALVFTILLTVIIIGIGTVFTIYVDLEVEWSMIEVASLAKVAFAAVEVDQPDLSKNTEFFTDKALELLCRTYLDRLLNENNLSRLVDLDYFASSERSLDGTFYWKVQYKYNFPSAKRFNLIEFPIRAVVMDDGLGFESGIVYITRTGVKYHVDSCHHLAKSRIAMDYLEAAQRGYEACKNCNPQVEE